MSNVRRTIREAEEGEEFDDDALLGAGTSAAPAAEVSQTIGRQPQGPGSSRLVMGLMVVAAAVIIFFVLRTILPTGTKPLIRPMLLKRP